MIKFVVSLSSVIIFAPYIWYSLTNLIVEVNFMFRWFLMSLLLSQNQKNCVINHCLKCLVVVQWIFTLHRWYLLVATLCLVLWVFHFPVVNSFFRLHHSCFIIDTLFLVLHSLWRAAGSLPLSHPCLFLAARTS